MRRAIRRAIRRLTSPRAGAVVVAAAIGLSGGLLSPVSAEAVGGPTPCLGGFLCSVPSISTPSIGSTSVPSKLTVPGSSSFHVSINPQIVAPPSPPKPKPKPGPPIVKGIASAALAAAALKSIFSPPGGPTGRPPRGNGQKRVTVTKSTTTTTTSTGGRTYAPGPGQRPRPKKVVTPTQKPQGPSGKPSGPQGKPSGPRVRPRAVPRGPATSTPRNARSRRGGKGRQQTGRREPTREQQKAAAKHEARSQAVKKVKRRRRLKWMEGGVRTMHVVTRVSGLGHAFGPHGTGDTGVPSNFYPPRPAPLNRKGRHLEDQKKVPMPPQVHQMRGFNPTTNRNDRIRQSHDAKQARQRHPGKGRH